MTTDADAPRSCGCSDYHLADCPTRTAAADAAYADERVLDDYLDDYAGGGR